MMPAPTIALQRAIDLESVWQASRHLLEEALPHHSCSLMLGIDNFQPSTARHHVVQSQRVDYVPATSLAVSRPFLCANPQVPLYTYSQIVSQDPQALQRRIAQDEPLEEWAEFVHLAFWDHTRPMAVMSIRRSSSQPRFSHDELAFLEQIHPVIDAGLYRLRALEFERSRSMAMQQMLCGGPTPSLLFDADGSIVFATDSAINLWQRWNEGDTSPASRRAKARQGTDVDPSAARDAVLPGLVGQCPVEGSRRLRHPRIPGFSAVIEPVRLQGSVLSRPVYGMLTFTECPVLAEDHPGSPAPMLERLSPSERKVALLVAEGLRNNEIAERLCRSRRTVESQLNSIYGKCNVQSRTQLLREMRGA